MFAIVRSVLVNVVSSLTCLHLIVVSGRVRPTQQEFNKLAATLGITSQVVSDLHEIRNLQDSTLTLLLSPLMPPRRAVLERGVDVTA